MNDPNFSYADDSMTPVKRGLIRLVEAATGQRKLRRLYMANRRNGIAGESFFAAAVRSLAIDVRFDQAALDGIPATGPVVIVANHPYGVLDGIVISWLVQKVRSDFLVLTNAVLLRAPEIAAHVLPIDFAPTEDATRTNIESRAAARQHLDGGGCVVVFPAGGISTAPDRLGRQRATDGPWQPFTAQLIQRSRATVVPICFEGQNSRLFQIASHLSPVLRLSLIFHEVRSRIGTAMLVAIGRPIPFAELPKFPDRQGLADHLKALTYGLAQAFPLLALVPSATGPGRQRMKAPLGALKRRMSNGKRSVARKFAERLRHHRRTRPHFD
ncbi:MAG: lysophospholipid acyltransferase family protein [Janthinobacterium lividum]